MKNFLKLFTGIAIIFVLFFLFSNFAKANSVPRYLGYSGTLNSAAGSPVTGSYNIVFKIYNASSGGTALWTETHSGVDVSSGFFSVTLGDTTVLDLDFSERYWLGITVATDSEMTPRTPLSSVGYSFVSDVSYGAFTSSTAASTSTASGGNIYYNTGDGNLYVYDAVEDEWVDLTSQGTSIIDGSSTSTILTWDGSNWSENLNFLIDSSGVVTTGTWHGARVDISDYTNLAVDSDLVLTGDTLSVSSTIARVTDLHDSVTINTTTYDYLALIDQAITLGQIDISSDTNLSGDSEIVLTGDSLSISSTIARDSELHDSVTLNTSTYGYLTLTGQEIALGLIDISDYTNLAVDGDLVLTGDTLSVSSTIARTTDLHDSVTLNTSTYGYLSLDGQSIVLGQIDISDTNITQGTGITITSGSIATTLGTDINLASSEVTSTLALTNGGTGATTASGARTALGLGSVSLLSAIDSSYITDLTIVNADISASAGIVDTKLATISTAGKVADTALSALVTKLGSDISLSTEISGTLALTNGGTGATTASGARTSLGLGTLATLSAITSAYITDLTITNADISASAGIVDTKLATISTAGKVSDSALSSTVTKLGSAIDLATSEVSGYLPVSKGGLGNLSISTYGIPVYYYGSYYSSAGFMWNPNDARLGVNNSDPQHTLDVGGNIGLANSSYINWGATDGDTGYGLRDSAGTIQYKNSSGSWTNVASTPPLTGTVGQTVTFDSNGDQTATSILYIDSTNSKIGINTTTPSSTLDIAGTLGSYGLTLTANSSSGSSGGSTPAVPGEWSDYSANSSAQAIASAQGILTFDDGNTIIPHYSDVLGGETLLVIDSAGNETETGVAITTSGSSFVAKKSGKNSFIIAWYGNNDYQGYYRGYDSDGVALTDPIAFTAGNYNPGGSWDFIVNGNSVVFMFFNSNYYRTYYRGCYTTSCYVDSYSEPNLLAYAAYDSIHGTVLSNNTPLFVYYDSNSSVMKYSLYSAGSLSSGVSLGESVYPEGIEAIDAGQAIVTWNIAQDSKYLVLDCVSIPGTCSYGSAVTLETVASGHTASTKVRRLSGGEVGFFTTDFYYDGDVTYSSDIHYSIYDSTLTTQQQTTTTIYSSNVAAGIYYVDAGFTTNTFALVYGGDSAYYQVYSGGGIASGGDTYSASGSATSIHSLNSFNLESDVFANGSSMYVYYNGNSLYFDIFDVNGSSVVHEQLITASYYGYSPVVKLLSDGTMLVGYYGYPFNQYGMYAQIYDSSGVLQTAEFALSSTGSDQNTYNYNSLNISPMSDGQFLVTFVDWGNFYYIKYNSCSSGGFCGMASNISGNPTAYNTSVTTYGSGTTEKVFLSYIDSSDSYGKYMIFTESDFQFTTPATFSAGVTYNVNVSTLSNDNVVVLYNLEGGLNAYRTFDTSLETLDNAQAINSYNTNDSPISSDILDNGSVGVGYSVSRYGYQPVPAYMILDSTLSTVIQENTFVPVTYQIGAYFNIRSIPSLDKFIFSYTKYVEPSFLGAEFLIYGVDAGGGGGSVESSSVTSTADISFADTSSTIQWMLRMDTTSNTIHFLDAGGDDGVYLTQDSTSWTSNSDERLKTNILDLNVLDRIDNFRAVSFNWVKNGNADVGAIAQELYKVFPEVVTVGRDSLGSKGEGAWGIQYSKLGALALEGVKELKQQMDVYNALLLGGGMNQFINDEAISKSLVFSRNTAFTKHIALSQDSVGMALIQPGESGVHIVFKEVYSTVPIITLTLASSAPVDRYYVSDVDNEGFTIHIVPIASQDTLINWHAFAQLDDLANISMSSSTNSNDESSIFSDSLADLANNYLQINNLTDEDIQNAEDNDTNLSTVDEEVISDIVTTTEDNLNEEVVENIITDESLLEETSTTTPAEEVLVVEETIVNDTTTSTMSN